MDYIYKIVDQYWYFKTNCDLKEDKETALFRTDEGDGIPICTCYVEMTEKLPDVSGALFVKNREKEVYLDGNELWLKMENLSEGVPTFIARYSLDKSDEIHLWMLERYYPYSARMAHIWSAIDFPYQLLQRNILTLHSSLIEVNKTAVAFLAPSGTGKSTQARLWSEHRGARQLNGDKTALFCKDTVPYAAGLPFCGTSGICENYDLPLGALVFLSQAKENTIRRLTGVEALKVLLDNCFGYGTVPGCMAKMIDIATGILDKVPIYALACTPDERAVETLEQAMKKEGN